MPRKQVKLADIATDLKVSVGLVSLVLSGKSKEYRISDSIAEKVIQRASQLGYTTNQLARGLRTGKSGIIGLIVADIANPYFGKMARSIENEASKVGYHVMFGSSDENPEKQNSLINIFLSRQVDAMAIVPVRDSSKFFKSLKNSSTPIVFIDRYCDGIVEDVCCADNEKGGFELTNHLLQQGYRKIAAFVLDQVLSTNTDRIRGYRRAIPNSDYDSDNLVYTLGYHYDDISLMQALEDAIRRGCDSIFFANNNLAISSLSLFGKMGLRIPEDLGIVSFDNPEAFEISMPPITCYEQPIELICSTAVKTMYKKLDHYKTWSPSKRLFEGSLIIRKSSQKQLKK